MKPKYDDDEQANRLKALELAEKFVTGRTIVKFEETMPNVEALADLIYNWAASGIGVFQQIAEIQQNAIPVAQVNDNAPAVPPAPVPPPPADNVPAIVDAPLDVTDGPNYKDDNGNPITYG